MQGSVRVLKELSRDLTDSQIPVLAPLILPDIYRYVVGMHSQDWGGGGITIQTWGGGGEE